MAALAHSSLLIVHCVVNEIWRGIEAKLDVTWE
jgi:hypothetical protein